MGGEEPIGEFRALWIRFRRDGRGRFRLGSGSRLRFLALSPFSPSSWVPGAPVPARLLPPAAARTALRAAAALSNGSRLPPASAEPPVTEMGGTGRGLSTAGGFGTSGGGRLRRRRRRGRWLGGQWLGQGRVDVVRRVGEMRKPVVPRSDQLILPFGLRCAGGPQSSEGQEQGREQQHPQARAAPGGSQGHRSILSRCRPAVMDRCRKIPRLPTRKEEFGAPSGTDRRWRVRSVPAPSVRVRSHSVLTGSRFSSKAAICGFCSRAS